MIIYFWKNTVNQINFVLKLHLLFVMNLNISVLMKFNLKWEIIQHYYYFLNLFTTIIIIKVVNEYQTLPVYFTQTKFFIIMIIIHFHY